jgi:hypothetical protein
MSKKMSRNNSVEKSVEKNCPAMNAAYSSIK